MGTDLRLEHRQCDILASILRRYISDGVPVGSRAVVEDLAEPVSSATVRNVMAELEEAGFLVQPHVSAGRVPTDKAYRFYVDRVFSGRRLESATEKYIADSMKEATGSPGQLLAKTSQVLAEVSHRVGLVLGPAPEEKLLEHLKFVKLPDQRVLLVVVSRPDLVENKVLRLEEEFSQDELDRAANFLNNGFRGWSLRAIRLEIFQRIEQDRMSCDRMLKNLATLVTSGALADEEDRALYVDGASRIPELFKAEDVERVKDLLAALEEKVKVAKILTACLESSPPGVRALIGRENPERQMQRCTFIVAPFHYRSHAMGVLGVVGPLRMEYDLGITAVDYVAHLTTKLLSID